MERCIENAESHCKSYPRCYGCNAFRSPTNADRIRAMSDEELEAFLIDVDLDKIGSPFITEWGKWLKQPAEEGADNG